MFEPYDLIIILDLLMNSTSSSIKKPLFLFFLLFRSHTKLLEQQLQAAESKVKKKEKNIQKQDKELKMLRQQLTSARQEEIERLFMSLRSHRLNYQTIMESKNIDPDVKMVCIMYAE